MVSKFTREHQKIKSIHSRLRERLTVGKIFDMERLRHYLEKLYNEYASSIIKIEDEEFVDMVHLKAEFLEEEKLDIWMKLLGKHL